jgi:hypothetical protein
VRGEAEHVGEHAAGSDFRPGARATDYQWLLRVASGGEKDDIVAATEGGESMRVGVAPQLNLHTVQINYQKPVRK